MKRTVIAVDLYSDTVTILLGKLSYGNIKYTAIQFNEIMENQKLLSRSLLISYMPCKRSFTRWLHVPFRNHNKIVKVLPSLLDVELPFSIDDTVYSFPIFKRSGHSTQVLSVGALKKDITSIMEKFSEYRIKPNVIDHQGLALWSQTTTELPPKQIGNDTLRVLIYLAKNNSAIVVGQGTEFISAHALNSEQPSEILRVIRAVLSHLQENISDDKKISKIPQLVYDRVPYKIVWVWCGSGTEDKHSLSTLQNEINTIKQGEHIVHDNPAEFLLRGLITRVLRRNIETCDLSLDAETKLRRIHTKQSLYSAVSFLISGILLFATGTFIRSTAQSKLRKVNIEFSRLAQELNATEGTTGADAVLTASRATATKIETLRPFMEYFKPSMIDEIYELVHTARSNNLYYETISMNNSTIEITGIAENWDSPEILVTYFAKKGIQPVLNRKDALPDEKIPFTISWNLRK